jgi:putative ABC transport system permease protein
MVIVASLTAGFACTCLLVSFLIAESSVDSFHTKKQRIFQLFSDDPFGGTGKVIYANNPIRDYFANNFPEVEKVCQIGNLSRAEIEVGEEFTPLTLIETDPTFFEMFDFPSNTTRVEGLIITSEKATRLFGTTGVLGREVVVRAADTTLVLPITGILTKPTDKSHLKFDAIVNNRTFPSDPAFGRGGANYLLLNDPSSVNGLLSKVNSDSLRPTIFGQGKLNYYLEPLKHSYFNQSNRFGFMQNRSETFILVGWIVCGLILFMASFNFINLFLLSMQERRKEQGIRKTLGITVYQTIGNLGAESLIYILMSFGMGLVLVYSLLPVFNSLLETRLSFAYLSNAKVLAIIAGSVVILGAAVLFFSVLQQRRVVPLSMMRDTSAKIRFSKMFFTLQFFVSITLCVCAVTIIRQMDYIENEPLGFNRNIIQLRLSSNRAAFKERVLQIPGVQHAALSQGNPISGNMIVGYKLDDGRQFNPYIFAGDEDFLKTLDLKLISGTMGHTLVNETLVRYFGMKDPIGMVIPGTTEERISGVVKDFTCASFKQEIPPAMILIKNDAKLLLIDHSQTTLADLLPKIKEAWKEFYPDEYFDYQVIQQELMKKYTEETLFYKVVVASSVVSMVISCFGLFALSWAVIRSRAREMSIRKVFGATMIDILGLLTKSFAKRLAIAFVLAAPVGYYLMNQWLSRFVNKAPLNGWVFVVAAIVLATITLVTLGAQLLKAALSSPLNEIRE